MNTVRDPYRLIRYAPTVRSAEGQKAQRDAARAAVGALHAAMQEVSSTFVHEAQVADALLHALDDEPSITKLTSRFPVVEERSRQISVLDHYESCRREARIALWRVMLAEGCSIGEISRIFGLSRQLVSRQLRGSHGATADSDSEV